MVKLSPFPITLVTRPLSNPSSDNPTQVHLIRESLVALSNLVCGPQTAVKHALDEGLLQALANAWNNAPEHGLLSVTIENNVLWTYLNLVKNDNVTEKQILEVLGSDSADGGFIKHCLAIIPDPTEGKYDADKLAHCFLGVSALEAFLKIEAAKEEVVVQVYVGRGGGCGRSSLLCGMAMWRPCGNDFCCIMV